MGTLIYPGQTAQFTAEVIDQTVHVMSAAGVTWSVSRDIGTINANGLFTANSQIAFSGEYVVGAYM